ncbi:hypothetical protein A2U01_0019908 [Trifolium medium]|uniref:Aspartic peptidase DDI1-type domain-containing protein n=1 Tax=Trifolium medium TaxID=97028 RepID=A0A392NI39_9FABA|nr:hypothetical protein [Trifolium medium]
MGELQEQREQEVLAEECTMFLQRKIPPKREDPGIFTVSCCIGKATERALCDLGASISLMPLSFLKKWNLGKLSTTEVMELVLADQSTLKPEGIIKHVLVKIKDMVFSVDFVIVDIEEDANIPIILGRPFLATSRALMDMETGELTLKMGDKERTIKVDKDEREWCCKIDLRSKSKTSSDTEADMEELEEGMS